MSDFIRLGLEPQRQAFVECLLEGRPYSLVRFPTQLGEQTTEQKKSDSLDPDLSVSSANLSRLFLKSAKTEAEWVDEEYVEVCSNCGAYHSEKHNRCRTCQAL